ncbi:MAG: DUF2304 domain-containing protein [Pseudobutyrivibrio sp.]|nr:DUF2304 domain-containing protein [Pseudobutyrivibrio sp.]
MSVGLRTILLIGSIILFVFIYRKLKKSQLQLMDAFFWIVVSFVILVLSLFPNLGIFLATSFGVQSASNFIFLCIITLLLIKSFLQAIKVSSLEQKVINLTQEIAIRENIENSEGKETE